MTPKEYVNEVNRLDLVNGAEYMNFRLLLEEVALKLFFEETESLYPDLARETRKQFRGTSAANSTTAS